MSDLGQGMDARIGAPRALQLDIVAEDFFRRLDQRPLNAAGVLLGLQPRYPVPSYSSVILYLCSMRL